MVCFSSDWLSTSDAFFSRSLSIVMQNQTIQGFSSDTNHSRSVPATECFTRCLDSNADKGNYNAELLHKKAMPTIDVTQFTSPENPSERERILKEVLGS